MKAPPDTPTGLPLTNRIDRFPSDTVPETVTEFPSVTSPSTGAASTTTGAVVSRVALEVAVPALPAASSPETVRMFEPSASGTPFATNEPDETVAVRPFTITDSASSEVP